MWLPRTKTSRRVFVGLTTAGMKFNDIWETLNCYDERINLKLDILWENRKHSKQIVTPKSVPPLLAELYNNQDIYFIFIGQQCQH